MMNGRPPLSRLDKVKLVNAVVFIVLGAIIAVRGLTYGLSLWTYTALGILLMALGVIRLRGAGFPRRQGRGVK